MAFEIRLIFEDSEEALKSILEKAEVVGEYESIDTFYHPSGVEWKFAEKNLRVRTGEKVELIYRENAWHGDIKEEVINLKIPLQSVGEAERILKSWNFEKIFSYKKVGKKLKFKDQNKDFVWEDIEHLGPTIEIEGENEQEVKELLKNVTDLDYEILKSTVPEAVMEKLNGDEN